MREHHTRSALHCAHLHGVQIHFFVEFEMTDDDDIISEWLQFINQFQ